MTTQNEGMVHSGRVFEIMPNSKEMTPGQFLFGLTGYIYAGHGSSISPRTEAEQIAFLVALKQAVESYLDGLGVAS